MTATPTRALADRCPGLLRPHHAADGAVVRLRLPGGRITAAALTALLDVAVLYGDGRIQLTSRGNLQLRGVPVDDDGELPEAVQDAVLATGLIPSTTHELVRNITCSPLTGRIGGRADLRPLTDQLDRLLCSTPELAGLSGRFLFSLDDGRDDVSGLTSDLGVRAVCADRVQLIVGGHAGPTVALPSAAGVLVDLALCFLRHRDAGGDRVWHVRELPSGGAELLVDVDIPASTTDFPTAPANTPALSSLSDLRPGRLALPTGESVFCIAVPLGLLDARQVETITGAAAAGCGEVIVTPWRLLLVPDVSTDRAGQVERSLTAAGLDLDPQSGWLGLSACAGAPGCGRAAAPTGPMAQQIARHPRNARYPLAVTDLSIHVVACERRCGAPSTEHVEVLVLDSTTRISRRGGPAATDARPVQVVDAADLATILTTTTALARTGS